ncbi:MAG: hypothetical protein ACRDGM_08485 [bacterium]
MIRLLFVAVGGLLIVDGLAADEPLPAPQTYTIYSNNKRFQAVLDAQRLVTTIYRVAISKGEPAAKLWEMPGWFRVAALADDGEHLVTGYDGGNLLRMHDTDDETMLTFYRKGSPIRRVPLREIIPDRKVLRRTVSHYLWGSCRGFDAKGRFLVQTVDGREIAYDPMTGRAR